MTYIRRRDILIAVPLALCSPKAFADPRARPLVGFLNSLSRDGWIDYLRAFLEGLGREGYVDGQNVTIEYRWAEGHYDRLPGFAVELVQNHVDVLVATGGNPATLAAKSATSDTPIVFIVAGDPVKEGLVRSLNHPGGNMTGVSIITTPLEAKRLEMLHELAPNAAMAVLLNPEFSEANAQLTVIQTAARRLNQDIVILTARSEIEIEEAFRNLSGKRSEKALLIASDPMFYGFKEKLVALAAQHSIPAMYFVREFALNGGLISYGASLSTTYYQMGAYTGRILKGDKASDLPIVQPTRFELVLNLKTARRLQIAVPTSLQVAADEVIE
jgi:putative ABC transport system substrate-binding protein